MCEEIYGQRENNGGVLLSWDRIERLRRRNILKWNNSSFLLQTCRYLSWSADEDSAITSEASLRALEAFCSPSAAITYIDKSCWGEITFFFVNLANFTLALASLAASASAAMALCSCTGRRASFLQGFKCVRYPLCLISMSPSKACYRIHLHIGLVVVVATAGYVLGFGGESLVQVQILILSAEGGICIWWKKVVESLSDHLCHWQWLFLFCLNYIWHDQLQRLFPFCLKLSLNYCLVH